jgi:demethylmenaquinone methyltransferase/2-methoxy-6-polyprenyl-1,4-benzoquinol methylase
LSLSSLSKDPSRIAGMFDAIAGRYDLLNRVLSGGLDSGWRDRAIESLGLTGRETVLDLCTGTADLALAAVNGPRRARRVIGVDFAAAMLLLGRKKAAAAGSAIEFVRGDATHLPLRSATIDAVTIGFGIRNVEEPAAACREISRVLRRGGTLVILELSLPRPALARRCYLWYSKWVLPLVGRAISGHASAYTYLPASVEAFLSPDAFAQLLRDCGFSTVRAVPLTMGVVYMFVATNGDPGAV